MRKSELVILKFGGSVITDKEEPFTAKIDIIDRLAREVSEYRGKMIIIHGGGSFGHPIAHKYKIKEGYKENHQLIGLAETHLSMQKLNTIILQRLIKYGISAVSIPPLSTILSENGTIKKLDFSIIEKMVNMGFVPVLYGDTVLDEKMGFTIVSGDQIAAYLSVKLCAAYLIFVLDVDGLYTNDPRKFPEAKLIEEIDVQTLQKTINAFKGIRGIDVTGGIAEKVRWVTYAAERGTRVILINGNIAGRLKEVLRGGKTIGTYVYVKSKIKGENIHE